MDRKKILLIISMVVTVIIVILIGLGIDGYLKQKAISKDKANATRVATDFSTAWFNYTKQSDIKYLAKIKPYMTTDFYNATYYVNTERPQDFKDQLAMTGKVLNSKIEDYKTNEINIIITVETQETKSSKNIVGIQLILIKINDLWKVSDLK